MLKVLILNQLQTSVCSQLLTLGVSNVKSEKIAALKIKQLRTKMLKNAAG